jgi:hypothetical protein
MHDQQGSRDQCIGQRMTSAIATETTSILVMKETSPVIEALKWMLANRKQPNGKPWSMRALSEAAGLAPSHVGGIISGRQKDLGVATADALARVGNVRTLWLQTGKGPHEPYEAGDVSPRPAGASTPEPPVSETRVVSDAIEELINAAFDPARHKPGDVPVVVDALTSHAALLKDQGDPAYLARTFLDAVSDARAKGRRLTPDELPGAAFGVMKHRLSWAEERIAEYEAEADASLRAKGIEPRTTPHPALLAAQKRAGFPVTGTGGPGRDE